MTATPGVPVDGSCPGRFATVREAFADAFSEGEEVGAALAVALDGDLVIDLWGGHMDAARTRPWERDTIVNLYSCGKAVAATCALRLADRGLLDIDAPVARYWPEFAQVGKERVTVRELLSHRAGLPATERDLPPGTTLDWDAWCAALAAQAPWWEPGSAHGYHTNTFGTLVGELVRRVDGRSVGTYWREEVAGPAGIDFAIGFGPEHDYRVAELIRPERDGNAPPPSSSEPGTRLDLMRKNTGLHLPEGVDLMSRAWRAAEIPSTNGHGNARALALLFGALATDGAVNGVQLLSRAAIASAVEQQSYGEDLTLQRVTRFGLGYQLTMKERRLGPNPRAFGHFGMGGSLGFADPDASLGLGYAMNKGRSGWQFPHVRRLIDLVYEAL